MLLKVFILMAASLLQISNNSSIQPTTVTDIFLPQGDIVYNHDYATLNIAINTTKLFAESQKVCQSSRIIKSFIKKRAAKLNLSKPNYNLMQILVKRIHTFCEEDMEVMRTIQTSFGISPKSSRDERQVVLATALVTSLVTYFTTRQLVQMGSDEDSDELIGTTNHLIAAIEDHETRITRIEERQKQLDKVVNKLKDSLVLGLRTEDMFATIYSMSTYASEVSRHIKDINIGLFTLFTNNRLHPNLVNGSTLAKGISKLRKKALVHSKELILEHNSDVFMSHCDFVGFPDGEIKILLHLPLINPVDKLKLYKHIATPGWISQDGYQLLVDGQSEEYLAISSMGTLYATFSSSDLTSDCVSIRDTKLCKSTTSILKKTGGKEPKCLVNLFLGNLEEAKSSCTYRLRKPTQFAVRLNNEQIYFYSPNSTKLQQKCLDDPSSGNSTELDGANILTIKPGCTMSTSGYVFSRAKQIVDAEVRPVYINTIQGELFQLFSEKPVNMEVQSLLNEMIDETGSGGLKLSDIEAKFGLHKLHHKTTLTRQVFSSITSVLFLVGAILLIYVCRKNFDCSRKTPIVRRPFPETNASSWIPMVKPNVADLQDFDSLDTKETSLSGSKEEPHSGQGPSNPGKKLKTRQAKSSN